MAHANPNPFETRARIRKALALVDELVRLGFTADDAAQLDALSQVSAAHLARVNVPSTETWSLVVSALRARERSERCPA